jgi:hypothetical protein
MVGVIGVGGTQTTCGVRRSDVSMLMAMMAMMALKNENV